MKAALMILLLAFITACTKEGPEGKMSLVDLADELPGPNCQGGGIRITTGVDLNKNGTLEGSEIQVTRYVCNGVNGTNGISGANSIVSTILEGPGTHCPQGGYKMISGVDLNGNNELDQNEIQQTNYICNGETNLQDRQIIIYFPANGYSYETSSSAGTVEDFQLMHDFNIDNYPGADSIVFGSYLRTTSADSKSIAELYNKTADGIVTNSTISSNSLNQFQWVTTTDNFLNNMPKGNLMLGIKLRTESQGVAVSYYLPCIIIYRK